MKRLCALLLLPCLLGACGAPCIKGGAAGAPPLKKQIEVSYPDSFRAQHRVTLTLRGKQIDFTGYLLVRHPGAWRAVAFGEFGGSLFDISSLPEKGLRIIRNPGGIRERWLTGPAADIISLLYLPFGGQRSASWGGGVYEVLCSDYAEFPGGAQAIPRHITVENKAMELKLEIDLVKLEPMALPDKYFDHE
mgnify:CR=1 FL=1